MAKTTKKTVGVTENLPTQSVKEEVSEKKIPAKLDDSVMIAVKSNVYGELIYVNQRTGDQTVWSGCGDVQVLTMGDLRAMKGTQRSFFVNQWIYIVGVEDSGYEDVTPEYIYRNLMVSQYYKSVLDPDNYAEIFTWKEAKIRDAISYMSEAAKTNLIVAANTSIADGTLDSLKTIRLLEECLGCELQKP